MAEIVCIGILVADVVGKPIDGMPERGKLQLAAQMELHTGGCAANTGLALAKIGLSTAVVGLVGRDGFGDFMVNSLEKGGLDVSGIARTREANTSSTMVLVHSDGERSFIHYLGANALFSAGDISQNIVHRARVVHIGGSMLMPAFDGKPTAAFLREARELGLITSLDTAWDSHGRWMSVLEPCLQHLDYFIPSIEEARMLTGLQHPERVAVALMERGVRTVALKMGAEGCYVCSKDFGLRLPAYAVPAVDALGAGDAFAAGFLTGVVRGWDLAKTGQFANAVGALSVTALGATTGVRSEEETLKFMRAKAAAMVRLDEDA